MGATSYQRGRRAATPPTPPGPHHAADQADSTPGNQGGAADKPIDEPLDLGVWPERRFWILLRKAREQAQIGQRQIVLWLLRPGVKNPYDQSWISRVETGSVLPPDPIQESWVFERLRATGLPLPASARLAAHLELVLRALAPVVDLRAPFSAYLRDLVADHVPDLKDRTLQATDRLPFPGLFRILVAGQARAQLARRAMNDLGVEAGVDPLAFDVGRKGAKTFAAEVDEELHGAAERGLPLGDIEAWPLTVAFADLVDAMIHVQVAIALESHGGLVGVVFRRVPEVPDTNPAG